ncbi:TasA family protein [Oribacterium sp. WCC10]|uniref:TasA family protein n=1 Tax=Oribacterium sp. WCC10 TaxID=1855343 RepID=UPI0008ECA430|nr:TasA family protein [Oribacterium sp. WCC10]SFG12550.1 Camelysin metallo-endopeptidase [Oribacterium sp. WCC10]
MKIKRIAAVTITMAALLSALTGSYAYFTDKELLEITARASNLNLFVDRSEFTDDKVSNMLPGDSRDLSYTVENVGAADALVFTEITLVSSVPMDDTVEWFIQDAEGSLEEEDRQVDPEFSGEDFVDDVTISELMDNKIKFVSLTEDNKVAKFVVNNGILTTERNQNKCKVDLKLMLGLNAGKRFMDSTCEVIANVYGIQTENLEDNLSWEFIKDSAYANEMSEFN